MSKPTEEISNEMSQLAEDARALIAATADVAGEKVAEARKRLSAALESGKDMYYRVRSTAIEGAKVADQTVHEHPYAAAGVAFGLGAVVGFLLTRRNRN